MNETNIIYVQSNTIMLMNKEQRQHRILHLIEHSNGEHMLGTRELAEQLGVSEMTVRRDLQELSEDGLLRRQHGGAHDQHRPLPEHGQPRDGTGGCRSRLWRCHDLAGRRLCLNALPSGRPADPA